MASVGYRSPGASTQRYLALRRQLWTETATVEQDGQVWSFVVRADHDQSMERWGKLGAFRVALRVPTIHGIGFYVHPPRYGYQTPWPEVSLAQLLGVAVGRAWREELRRRHELDSQEPFVTFLKEQVYRLYSGTLAQFQAAEAEEVLVALEGGE